MKSITVDTDQGNNMIESQLPCVLLVSDFKSPDFLVEKILKTDVLPEGLVVCDGLKGYTWKIDTKYYKTSVNLCSLKSDIPLNENISTLVEGLVLYYDSRSVQSFESLTKWSEDIKVNLPDACLPDILLLVCDSFDNIGSNGVDKSAALDWCLHNGYELIELEYADDECDEDEIIPDHKGVDRIIEALHTHMWSNLDMKSKSNGVHDENSDEITEDFSELFSQLQFMKESIQSLPPRDRRACAEQVVSTFWKAIGGDDEELDDIIN